MSQQFSIWRAEAGPEALQTDGPGYIPAKLYVQSKEFDLTHTDLPAPEIDSQRGNKWRQTKGWKIAVRTVEKIRGQRKKKL